MARKNSRALWTDKILRGTASAATAPAPMARRPYTGHVLGIDPSLRGTGLSVIAFDNGNATFRASRRLRLGPGLTMPDCLGAIYKAVADCIEDWPIRHVALEQTIYVQNFQTAQILGAARGAAIAAAAVLGKPVFEYPPLRVKQAVVGFGRASKEQIGDMTRRLLHLPAPLSLDESDATAVALCHAFTWRGD
ncbi:MAG: crossover junction endodeoxyribonuclease RuvC [Puniceicoccales bacterium]|jgi:crossover junction endodeoxyribonuclease RuvC|nr:crossover junction endodeoxyribonuclease RuvC [Puniceicoccales bacterium]